ncbi:hypothetical protein VTJ83DRAFT_3766 [Remersonia thermophila]|uniref:1,3-beta-glucanosyltransferase n=1 Tax=Remersonia thermophila TaxID=72144 RepID=A0ABR4DFJ2_9PEZI
MRTASASLLSASLLLGQASAALPPIVMKGTKFFYENGTQFFMNGIAYQQEYGAPGTSTSTSASNVKYADPLANPEACKRDVPLLKALRTNTIRTYAIDPDADHDECMKLLDEAGIYVISDLSEPALSINRDDPKWNVELYERYTAVVKSLSKYSNVIGFFAGNEVSNNRTNTPASAYVKAAVRDTKAYINDNFDRWMGVGYAANDDPDIRIQSSHYFNCGPEEDSIDYWGYNIYSWCGKSSMSLSGFDKQVEFFQNYSVPVFFAEYGCNLPNGADGRIWEETKALYSDEMTDVFSGGIVYMFHQEANDYGLVEMKGNTAKTMKNFDTLKTAMASVNPSSTSMSAYTPTNSPQPCPPIDEHWKVTGSVLPPKPDRETCDCMYSAAACVPADSLKVKDYGEIFNYICGAAPEACVGISGNATTGVYGAYSMCNAREQLAFVLDQYYQLQNSDPSACDFGGKATLVGGSGQAEGKCATLLASASAVNEAAATSTGEDGPEESENAGVAFGPARGGLMLGELAVGMYVVVAMAVGASMVLL